MTAPAQGRTQENWSSRMTFLMASIGFAVGLGNIWRFPYVVGENGGSAFVLVYLLFAFGIGVPLVMAEWTIGRRGSGAASASGSVREVARQSGASIAWGNVGGLAVLAVFMLMLFYTVIAGWTMDYLVRAASGAFQGINAERSKAMFDNLMANPLRLGFWHTVVVLLTVYINSRGLKGGIEKAVNILMPALFVSLLLMVGYASVVGDFGAAVDFLLTPDFSRLKADTMLMALGQAFFSIGIAMAVMITYGSYLDRQTSIPRNAFIVVGADTLVALLAGFAIFPLVFAHQLAPDSGAGLVFQTLPIAFGDLPGGQVFGSGLGTVFSFNVLSDFHPLSFLDRFGGMTIYDSLDYVMSNILLPVGAFLTSIFIGWFASNDAIREEMGLPDGLAYRSWRILIRFIVPAAVAIIFAVSIRG